MTVFKFELKRGRISFIIWTGVIAMMLAITVFVYPLIKTMMENMDFSGMGALGSAFSIEQSLFSTLIGYYAVEALSVLGLGGAIYAAMCGAAALSCEESAHTAEFLFSHPVSRARVVTEKLVSVVVRLTAMNAVILLVTAVSALVIGEKVPWKEFLLIHLAFYLLQLEIACICFGVSAFKKKGGVGIGIGVAAIMYFLQLIGNITEKLNFLNYFTPFGFCTGTQIIADGKLDLPKIAIGMALLAAGITAAYLKYTKKDLQ